MKPAPALVGHRGPLAAQHCLSGDLTMPGGIETPIFFCQDSPLRAQTEAANLRQKQIEDRATGRTRARPLSQKTKWYISVFLSPPNA